MPEGTQIIVVKNKLMEIAVRDTEFSAATSMLKGANMWFFIEEDIGSSIKAYNAFCKTYAKKESHPINGGVIDNTAYDGAGVESIGKLPSKLELYAKIAGAIQAVPRLLSGSHPNWHGHQVGAAASKQILAYVSVLVFQLPVFCL
jgi:large subunit ribosomal protein L10